MKCDDYTQMLTSRGKMDSAQLLLSSPGSKHLDCRAEYRPTCMGSTEKAEG